MWIPHQVSHQQVTSFFTLMKTLRQISPEITLFILVLFQWKAATNFSLIQWTAWCVVIIDSDLFFNRLTDFIISLRRWTLTMPYISLCLLCMVFACLFFSLHSYIWFAWVTRAQLRLFVLLLQQVSLSQARCSVAIHRVTYMALK